MERQRPSEEKSAAAELLLYHDTPINLPGERLDTVNMRSKMLIRLHRHGFSVETALKAFPFPSVNETGTDHGNSPPRSDPWTESGRAYLADHMPDLRNGVRPHDHRQFFHSVNPFKAGSRGSPCGSVVMFIRQNSAGVTFWIIVLTRPERPEEGGEPQTPKKQRNRNQNNQDIQ